jgi:hypothetical protein
MPEKTLPARERFHFPDRVRRATAIWVDKARRMRAGRVRGRKNFSARAREKKFLVTTNKKMQKTQFIY